MGFSYKFFAATVRALVASTASASLSAISSSFVMIFILLGQGRTRLNDAYHRIMFFMSFWDLVSSLSIAATTLPMPADVHDVYDFAGKAIGTLSSCRVQAFLIVMGSGFTIYSNCILNFYYVCTIRFKMMEEKFSKVILPISLCLAVVTVVPAATILLEKDLPNPVPFYPYCAVGIYPMKCVQYDDGECIMEGIPEFEAVTTVLLCTGMVTILISMILVVTSVFKIEKERKRNETVALTEEQNDDEEVASNGTAGREREEGRVGGSSPRGHPNEHSYPYSHTRETMRQALMYIAAFLLTWGWVILALAPKVFSAYYFIDPMKFTFQPLQGFFNASIFFYSKVYILRKSDRHLSFWQGVKIVFLSPRSVPDILVERMDIVLDDEDDGSSVHSPAQNLVRRGSPLQRTDEPPRAIPDEAAAGAHDFESMKTPSFSMVLSSKGNQTNDEKEEVSHDHDDDNDDDDATKESKDKVTITKKDDTKTPARRFYQWPPPNWPRSVTGDDGSKGAVSQKSGSDSGNHSVTGLLSWASPSSQNTLSGFHNRSLEGVDDSRSSSPKRNMPDNAKSRSDSEKYSVAEISSWGSSFNNNDLSISACERDADSIDIDSHVSA